VFWILPAIKPEIRNVVREVADMHGDLIVPIEHLSPDGVHPTTYEYEELARKVK